MRFCYQFERQLTFLEKTGIFGTLLGVFGSLVLTDAARSGFDTILEAPSLATAILVVVFVLCSLAAISVLIVHEIWRDSIPFWTLRRYLSTETKVVPRTKN